MVVHHVNCTPPHDPQASLYDSHACAGTAETESITAVGAALPAWWRSSWGWRSPLRSSFTFGPWCDVCSCTPLAAQLPSLLPKDQAERWSASPCCDGNARPPHGLHLFRRPQWASLAALWSQSLGAKARAKAAPLLKSSGGKAQPPKGQQPSMGAPGHARDT